MADGRESFLDFRGKLRADVKALKVGNSKEQPNGDDSNQRKW